MSAKPNFAVIGTWKFCVAPKTIVGSPERDWDWFAVPGRYTPVSKSELELWARMVQGEEVTYTLV